LDRRWLLLAIGIGLVILLVPSVYSQVQAFDGVSCRQVHITAEDGTELAALTYWPAGADGPLPGVVVVHGFSASKETMQHYSLGLARAGFYVIAIDVRGHGGSGGCLQASGYAGALTENLALDVSAAIDYLESQPQAVTFSPKDSSPGLPFRPGVAVLGHSMGGGAVLETGLEDARVVSVVAVAAHHDGGELNSTLPPNLLLAVGAEDNLVPPSGSLAMLRNATGDDYAVPGVFYSDFDDGTARQMLLAPGSGHVGEIWDATIIAASINWVEESMGLSPSTYDPTPLMNSVNCLYASLAGLLILIGCIPVASVWATDRLLELPRRPVLPAVLRPRWKGAAVYMAVGVLGAVLGLPLGLLLVGFPLTMGGVLTGLFIVWGLLAAVALLLLRRRGNVPSLRELAGDRQSSGFGVVAAILSFAALYVVFYVLMNPGFLDVTPTPLRWALIALLSVAYFPLTLADGWLLWGVGLAHPRGNWVRLAADGTALYLGAKLAIFLVGTLLVGPLFLFLGAFVAGAVFLQAVVGSVLYARAPTVVACAAFNAIWLAYLVGGVLPFMSF